MPKDEIQELLDELSSSGVKAMLCDTPVRFIRCKVPCGNPGEPGDEDWNDSILLPKEVLGLNPELYIIAEGNSMIDGGIEPGDKLRIRCCKSAKDGDTVFALVDGKCTVKSLFTDEEGMTWLVPRNDDYDPIQVTESSYARVLGIVVGIEKAAPRASMGTMLRAVKRKKSQQALLAKKAASQAAETDCPDLFLVSDTHTRKDCEWMLNNIFQVSASKKKVCEELYKLDGIYFKLGSVSREERVQWLNRFPSKWQGEFKVDDMRYFCKAK